MSETAKDTPKETKKKKKGEGLSAFSILAIILVALGIITMIMAACNVQGVEGATIADITTAPILGFADALPVCLFVLVLGGFLGVVGETGALDDGIGALVHKMNGKEILLIPILMIIFSIGGTTYGMWEETVPFALLLAATMVAAGYDTLTGVAIVLAGAGCGVLGSTVNPFAVGAAVDALSSTGIEVNQGIILGLGAVLWICSITIAIIYVMRYARRVKDDRSKSYLTADEVADMNATFSGEEGEAATGDKADPTLTGRQKATLIVFGITFVIMIIGFIPWGEFGIDIWGWTTFLVGVPLGEWYFNEASTWFLLMTIIIGFVAWMGEPRFIKAFLNGAADMISVVLIIAVARSITVLMGETGLDQWILNAAAGALSGVASFVFAPASLVLYMLLTVLIPSSSGMATVSMPIMGPLAAQLGFSVEVMIMIFVAGSGLVNLITPTAGALVGGLALAKVKYATWLKFFLKLFIILAVMCLVVLTLAMMFIPATA